jgi:hypothetical protein
MPICGGPLDRVAHAQPPYAEGKDPRRIKPGRCGDTTHDPVTGVSAARSSRQRGSLGLAAPSIQKEPADRGGVGVKHLRTHDTLITDLVDAHLGSVETRTVYRIDRAVPKQDADRPGAIAPKARAQYTLLGTLKGRPRARMKPTACATAPSLPRHIPP